jgi:hybrid cluster-associated redox disulfide protein
VGNTVAKRDDGVKEQCMIDQKMSVEEIVRKYPETLTTFERHGLGCWGCEAALFENIEQGAKVHGVDVEVLIRDLNQEIEG